MCSAAVLSRHSSNRRASHQNHVPSCIGDSTRSPLMQYHLFSYGPIMPSVLNGCEGLYKTPATISTNHRFNLRLQLIIILSQGYQERCSHIERWLLERLAFHQTPPSRHANRVGGQNPTSYKPVIHAGNGRRGVTVVDPAAAVQSETKNACILLKKGSHDSMNFNKRMRTCYIFWIPCAHSRAMTLSTCSIAFEIVAAFEKCSIKFDTAYCCFSLRPQGSTHRNLRLNHLSPRKKGNHSTQSSLRTSRSQLWQISGKARLLRCCDNCNADEIYHGSTAVQISKAHTGVTGQWMRLLYLPGRSSIFEITGH